MNMVSTKHNIRARNINQAMSRFYDIEGLSFEEALQIVRGIEDDLVTLLPDYQSKDNDYRLGRDSYGYGEYSDNPAQAAASILANLQYISDRWGGAYRIAWMLGLVNPDYR